MKSFKAEMESYKTYTKRMCKFFFLCLVAYS